MSPRLEEQFRERAFFPRSRGKYPERSEGRWGRASGYRSGASRKRWSAR